MTKRTEIDVDLIPGVWNILSELEHDSDAWSLHVYERVYSCDGKIFHVYWEIKYLNDCPFMIECYKKVV